MLTIGEMSLPVFAEEIGSDEDVLDAETGFVSWSGNIDISSDTEINEPVILSADTTLTVQDGKKLTVNNSI